MARRTAPPYTAVLGLERVGQMVELLEPGIGVVLSVLGVTWDLDGDDVLGYILTLGRPAPPGRQGGPAAPGRHGQPGADGPVGRGHRDTVHLLTRHPLRPRPGARTLSRQVNDSVPKRHATTPAASATSPACPCPTSSRRGPSSTPPVSEAVGALLEAGIGKVLQRPRQREMNAASVLVGPQGPGDAVDRVQDLGRRPGVCAEQVIQVPRGLVQVEHEREGDIGHGCLRSGRAGSGH